METKRKYVTDEDAKNYEAFVKHHLPHFAGLPPGPLYHYTTGEGLIAIIKSGELWATHMKCLNDAKELTYALDEIHKRVRVRLAEGADGDTKFLFEDIDKRLGSARPEIAGIFVTCFSEDGDDLSQWRAYARQEGGYAIEFGAGELATRALQASAYLVRVEYDLANQALLIDDILKWTEKYFLEGLMARRAPTRQEWIEEFVPCWAQYMEFFIPCIKHPKFRGEREWRLIHYLDDADVSRMQYQQRQSMMTRHVPILFDKKLPITGVRVGPARHTEMSVVAVSDLLRTYGYDVGKISVTVTEVPFRIA